MWNTNIEMNKLQLFQAITLILIVLLVVMWYNISRLQTDFLEGMWIADEDFCAKSDVDGIMLYIGSGYSEHKCHLIMHANNKVIVNTSFHISVWYWPTFGSQLSGSISISEDYMTEVFPLAQQFKLSLITGELIWSHDDTITLDLFKDNISSALGLSLSDS